MKISAQDQDSEAKAKWIEQFRLEHRAAAITLLESLTLVSSATVEASLERALFRIAKASAEPVACFIVRDTKAQPYFPVFERDDRRWRDTRPQAIIQRKPNHKGLLNKNAGVGSEALTQSWLTKWARLHDSLILNQPTFNEMAQEKCRDIIFLDDIIATGTRARDYLEKAIGHPTFKSWRSGQGIRFHYLCYSASMEIVRDLEASFPGLTVSADTTPRLGSTLWSDADDVAVREACLDAARRTGNVAMIRSALGYKGSLSTLIFEHSCPNNTPAVLWFTVEGKWRPLFPNRGVSRTIPLTTVDDRWLKNLPYRILNLTWRDENGHIDVNAHEGQNALRLLLALSKGKKMRHDERLSEYVGVELPTLKRLKKSLVLLRWIDNDLRVTDAGRTEVRFLRSSHEHPDWVPTADPRRFYFPRW